MDHNKEKTGREKIVAQAIRLIDLADYQEGSVVSVISGKALRCKEGEMVVMPANQPHALRAVKKFKMILTMIRS